MAKLDELVVELVAETSKLRAELKTAANVTEKAAAEMQKSIQEFTENSSKDVGFFETSMATMAGFLGSQAVLGVFGAVKDAARFMTDQLISGAKGAMEEEVALNRLANSLALVGNYSQSAQKDMEEFAASSGKATAKTTEQVANTISLLAAMTKLDNDGLKKATTASLDLAAAYGIDLETATRLVGKSIEGNNEAFKKFGITIQEGTNKTDNLNNVLKGLQSTNGAAAGAAKNFTGVLFTLSEAYDDVFEALGKSVTQNEVFKAVLNEVVEILGELTTELNSSGVSLKKNMADVLIQVIDFAGQATLVVDYFVRTVVGGFQGIMTVLNGLADSFKYVLNLITDVPQDDDPFKATKESFESLQAAFTEDSSLGKMAETLARLSNAGTEAMSSLTDTTDQATEATVRQGKVVAEITKAEQARLDQLKTFATGLADNATAYESYYTFQMEMLQASLDNELISREDFNTTKLEMIASQNAAEEALLADARAKKLIDDTQLQNAQLALAQKTAIAMKNAKKDQMDYEKLTDKQRQENMKSSFGTIATLATSSNKELAAIGKAAAITNATIDGFAAVQKALASAPPPYNFALAALVGVASAANVAKIAGVGLKGGIDSVPGVGSHDQFPATLAPGERVVPSQTNKDLKDFLSNQKKNGTGRSVTLNITIANNLPASREAGNAMIEAINEALANGSLRIDQSL